MGTPPQLTPEQRSAALAKAAEARAARADIKARLKMGSISLREALDSDDSNLGKLKVVSMLEALPGVGKVKARRVMDDVGIADNRRVQGLGAHSSAQRSSSNLGKPLIVVVSGPGGVGKGTIVDELVRRDDRLWLSRSWTTHAQRPGEPADAYEFTDFEAFEEHIRNGGFLEWTEFLGNYYGTPRPDSLGGLGPHGHDRRDIVLEIELDGAQQVKQQYPEAILIFVLPPSRDEQERRLRGRGDPGDKVQARLRKAELEEPVGRAAADYLVVNDQLDLTVDEMMSIIERERSR